MTEEEIEFYSPHNATWHIEHVDGRTEIKSMKEGEIYSGHFKRVVMLSLKVFLPTIGTKR